MPDLRLRGCRRQEVLPERHSHPSKVSKRLPVCGGRDYDDRELLFERLDQLHAVMPVSVLIDGGARRADELAGQWAEARGVERIRFPTDWKKCGRSAGPRRNQQMLVEGKPDLVIAFPGGTGANNMLAQAEAAGVPSWAGDCEIYGQSRGF